MTRTEKPRVSLYKGAPGALQRGQAAAAEPLQLSRRFGTPHPWRRVQPCLPACSTGSTVVVKAMVKEATEQAPSWAGLWTLSSTPSIYGSNIPTGKPDPPDGRTPRLIPRLSNA